MNRSEVGARVRVRRGNAEDHAAIRQQIMDAAFRLHHTQGGLVGLSMRGLAGKVGLSAMGLYRYFANKAALLQAMWEVVLTEALTHTRAHTGGGLSARDRLQRSIDGFFSYWEAHPEKFRLVFLSDELLNPPMRQDYVKNPAYQAAVDWAPMLIGDFIAEVGGDPLRWREARDLRMSLMVGYLHARQVNQRFPWGDKDALRANAVTAIMSGIEICVMGQRSSDGQASPGHRSMTIIN